MFVFILILLLIAAIFGVLGTVLKVAFVLVLAGLLVIATVGLLGYYWFRYRMRDYQRRIGRTGGAPPSQMSSPAPSSTIDVGEPLRDDRGHTDP
ncbi:MAG: hypothetical protein WEA10_02450 [Actinomycetota bacterium]